MGEDGGQNEMMRNDKTARIVIKRNPGNLEAIGKQNRIIWRKHVMA